jgi:zinc protease
MEGQANHLASWELLGDWNRGGDYLDALLATDADRLAEVATRYLSPEQAGLVAYRPAHAPAFATDAGQMRAQLDEARPGTLDAATRPGSPTPVPPSRSVTLDHVEGAVRVYRTAEGIPVLVQRRSGAIGYMGWFARGGGSTDAPAQAGLASLAARTALKGTVRRGSQRLAEDAEFLGGVLASSATNDLLQFTMSVPVRRMVEAAELLGDVVQRPSFLEESFEAERAVALASLASMRDDMYRWPMRVAQEAAWAGHPYGLSLLGTEETLARLTPADLVRFHANHVLASSGAVVIVGDLDPDEAAALAGRAFGGLRVGPDPKVARASWPVGGQRLEESREKAQSALAILFEGPAREDDDRTSAALIASVASGLGGRFFDELRDRQSLAYTVMAAPIVRRSGGAFAAYIATSPEKQEQAERGLLSEFAKLCESSVTDRELEQAKTYLRGSWAIRRESGAAVAGDLADAWLFGRSLEEIDAYDGRIRAATASDLLACARRYFDPARRITAVVRGSGRRV